MFFVFAGLRGFESQFVQTGSNNDSPTHNLDGAIEVFVGVQQVAMNGRQLGGFANLIQRYLRIQGSDVATDRPAKNGGLLEYNGPLVFCRERFSPIQPQPSSPDIGSTEFR